MKRFLDKPLRRFRRDESGGALTIEFVIFVPLLFGCLLMSVELGIYAMRNMFLERGLDITVRHVRLNTNTPMTHAQLKDMICEYSGFLKDCDQTLRLEMAPVNPRNFAAFDQQADCVDISKPVEPVRGFKLGQDHELMLLRACVKFDPIYPTTGLGYAMEKDGSGKARMIATTAFVQEPS
ncbi:TadE/TadG family type IV pilus assembly protein [Sulfitobacter aestuarii]|uniref:TadE/TadG family type IV pilus assembly protein n=1 Tax=Sulfitobacter aestuarii TaxID=2161676 RepID=A0ABW5TYN8_9RHOB